MLRHSQIFRYILKEGGIAFGLTGTEKSKGTKLVSLDGGFRNPGLFEVRMGTPLRFVIERAWRRNKISR